MSRLVNERAQGRRAIDLVHRIAPGHFEFIELKTGSNTPLYAAFEILGYGLSWCLARQHPAQHREFNRKYDLANGIADGGDHVLDARRMSAPGAQAQTRYRQRAWPPIQCHATQVS